MVIASGLKAGMALHLEGHVFKVLQSDFKAGAGQAGGLVKSLLQNVVTGREIERRFHPDEKLEDLPIERRTMEYLYADGENCIFMDPASYEQVEVPRALLGKMANFLQEGSDFPVELCDEKPISVTLPDSVEARVAETAPAQHSGQDSTWKEAVLDNGVQLLVPLFVAPGELIRMDPRTGKYLERVRLEKKKGA
ncbi:MAG TPA: elongation factor P [Terriglobales bacterium]|nr:elongation factor P [Terriglobales bacterium]